jgi:hypothetical protein
MQKVPGVLAVGVAAALVTACSGSSHATNAGGPGSSSSPGASASASASASGAASASPTGKPAPPPTPATGHTVASGPGSKPPGRPNGFTQAGTYTYDITGTTTTRIGTRPVSGSDKIAVDPPKGTQQKSTQKSQNGTRDETLNVTSAGVTIVDIHIQQPGFNEDFKPVGTAVDFPGDYHVGSAWKWSTKSTDGKYRLEASSKISASTKVTVHGQTMPVLVVDSVLRFTGQNFNLTDNQRDWLSTAYALVVKEHLATKGTIAGFTYSADETRTIRSTTPSSS